MNLTLMICTSKNCPYRKTCCHQTRSDPDDIDEVSYNFEYTCNSSSGFPDYILDTRYEKGVLSNA